MALGAIGRSPRMADVVTDRLRQAILSGELSDEQPLPLAEVAQMLDVSQMPVREALINLANEGLVTDHGRRGGYRVKALKATDLEDVYELHAHLHATLAARAAAVISERQIAELKTVNEAFVEELSKGRPNMTETARLNDLNDKFHRLINRSQEGDLLRLFLRSTAKFVRTDSYAAIPGWIDATLHDHPAIIAALEAHDADRARMLMYEHISQGARLSSGAPRDSPAV